MPGGLPMVRGLSPGVLLVPGVGASFLGVGVLDFRLGVEDLSFCNRDAFKYVRLCGGLKHSTHTHRVKNTGINLVTQRGRLAGKSRLPI